MQAYFGEVASECILIKRAPSWIQTRKRLGERRKCVLGSGSWAERRSNPHTFPGQVNMATNSSMVANLRSRALKKKCSPCQFVNFSFNYHQRNNVNSRGNEDILIVPWKGKSSRQSLIVWRNENSVIRVHWIMIWLLELQNMAALNNKGGAIYIPRRIIDLPKLKISSRQDTLQYKNNTVPLLNNLQQMSQWYIRQSHVHMSYLLSFNTAFCGSVVNRTDITVSVAQRINEQQLTCKLYYHQFNINCVSAIIPGFYGKPTQPTAFKLVRPWLIIAYDVHTDQLRFDSKLY